MIRCGAPHRKILVDLHKKCYHDKGHIRHHMCHRRHLEHHSNLKHKYDTQGINDSMNNRAECEMWYGVVWCSEVCCGVDMV